MHIQAFRSLLAAVLSILITATPVYASPLACFDIFQPRIDVNNRGIYHVERSTGRLRKWLEFVHRRLDLNPRPAQGQVNSRQDIRDALVEKYPGAVQDIEHWVSSVSDRILPELITVLNAANSPRYDRFMHFLVEQATLACFRRGSCANDKPRPLSRTEFIQYFEELAPRLGMQLEMTFEVEGTEEFGIRLARANLFVDTSPARNGNRLHGAFSHAIQLMFFIDVLGVERGRALWRSLTSPETFAFWNVVFDDSAYNTIFPSPSDITRQLHAMERRQDGTYVNHGPVMY